jgi:hypothetical protein
MNRLVPGARSSAIQPETKPDNGAAEAPATAEAARISLGWQIAMIVWLCGLAAVGVYEVWGTVWKIGKGLIGSG